MAQQPLVGHSLLIFEATLSHSDTPQSVGLLWTGDQPIALTLPDHTQHSQEKNIRFPEGLESAAPASEWAQIQALDRAAIGVG
jgi:hypothetical protein